MFLGRSSSRGGAASGFYLLNLPVDGTMVLLAVAKCPGLVLLEQKPESVWDADARARAGGPSGPARRCRACSPFFSLLLEQPRDDERREEDDDYHDDDDGVHDGLLSCD